MKTQALSVNNIYHMDCVDGMRMLEDESVNTIIADPPFSIKFKGKKANYNRKQSLVIDEYDDILEEDYFDWTFQWLSQAKRILRKDGNIFIFSGWTHLHHVLNAINNTDLILYNHCIWKYNFGIYCSKKFISSHYHILCLCKNEKLKKHFPNARFNKTEKDEKGRKKYYIDREDVWIINREYWTGETKTPTKLPAEVIEKLIVYSTEENDLIVDPFSGSGQVSWLCKHNLNRHFIAFEKELGIYKFSKERLDTGQYLIK